MGYDYKKDTTIRVSHDLKKKLENVKWNNNKSSIGKAIELLITRAKVSTKYQSKWR